MKYYLKIVPHKVEGVIKIREDCQYNAIEADKVIVDENVTARLYGTVKDVEVKKGARVFLHGIVYGKIKNKGELLLFG